jgi:PQQ enzyme repeat/PQQ-like domain
MRFHTTNQHGTAAAPIPMAIGRRVTLAALALLVGTGVALFSASHTTQRAGAASAATLGNPVWTATINDGSGTITASSPTVGDEVNPNAANAVQPAVVVGDIAGNVYAYDLASGKQDWQYPTGGPVQTTPSVAPTTAGSNADSVFVGIGDAATPAPGVPEYQAITPQGTSQWKVTQENPATDPGSSGVQSSLAAGSLQGQTDVTAGSLGQNQYALTASNGATLSGFPWFQADSSFSSPALADVEGNGQTDIVEGYAATTGTAYGFPYQQGGYLRVIAPTGNTGQPEPNGGLVCQYHSDQTIDSSPAVGEFLGSSAVGIAVGTSDEFAGASGTDDVLALNNQCQQVWSQALNGSTQSSPALANLGNGQLDVVEGTVNDNGAGGSVYALNGATGAVLWSTPVSGAVYGGVATADLGEGYQDVIVPTTDGVQILDGKTGAVVQTILQNYGFQNVPLITDDPNGTIGITLAGYQRTTSYIWHYEIGGSNGSVATEGGAWPEFHLNPQLTGDTGTPAPTIQVPCNAPKSPYGYDLAASDGGIFTFGDLPFCGSTGSIVLNKPIVGIALTKDGGGYWMDASDGGIFAFGDATFYGSVPGVLKAGQVLNKPIVGMASTPDGKGYWMVASDGGIFSFGDALFYGSTGGLALNKPMVGMASTPDGKGYWLVASDGGVFAFGDAKFYGSVPGQLKPGQTLNAPIVGMAAAPGGAGYWIAASDGGLFSFGDATFLGSVPGVLKPGQVLNAPIVGMQSTADGKGYRFVATDGGVFNFGDALSYGSMGGKPLNKPMVGLAGF